MRTCPKINYEFHNTFIQLLRNIYKVKKTKSFCFLCLFQCLFWNSYCIKNHIQLYKNSLYTSKFIVNCYIHYWKLFTFCAFIRGGGDPVLIQCIHTIVLIQSTTPPDFSYFTRNKNYQPICLLVSFLLGQCKVEKQRLSFQERFYNQWSISFYQRLNLCKIKNWLMQFCI